MSTDSNHIIVPDTKYPPIPPNLVPHLLPPPDANIFDLLHFSTPPDTLQGKLSDMSEVFSSDPPIPLDEKTVLVLRGLDCPNLADLEEVERRLEAASPEQKLTFQSICEFEFTQGRTNAQRLKLPDWSPSYWRAVTRVVREKNIWDPIVRQLQRDKDHRALHLLRSLPWSAKLPGFYDYTVVNLAELLHSHAWLSDTHIDIQLRLLEHHLIAVKMEVQHYVCYSEMTRNLEIVYRLYQESCHERAREHKRDTRETRAMI